MFRKKMLDTRNCRIMLMCTMLMCMCARAWVE